MPQIPQVTTNKRYSSKSQQLTPLKDKKESKTKDDDSNPVKMYSNMLEQRSSSVLNPNPLKKLPINKSIDYTTKSKKNNTSSK